MNLLFARQSAAQEPEYSGERLIGMFPQVHPDRGNGQLILAPSPGYEVEYELASRRPVRALYAEQGELYAASAGQLWRGSKPVGSIPDNVSWISGNGREIVVVADGAYYVYNKTTGALEQVALTVFDQASSVTMLDSYIILTERDGQRFCISALNEATVLDALDFAAAESASDKLVRAYADHSELWLFGETSIEIWQNTGNNDFPFQRVSGGRLERGCAYAGSVASDDNTVFWIGNNRLVYRARGYTPEVISTPYVAKVLASLSKDANVSAFTYVFNNSTFYVIRLPDRPALVFDASTGLWHERSTNAEYGPWFATDATAMNGKIYIGTGVGQICTLGGLTDGGALLMREATSIPLSDQRRRFSLDEVQLHFRTGQTDIGRDAMVAVQHSTNGREWKPARWRSLGGVGEYDRLIRCSRMGMGRQHQIRWRITDPIDVSLYGAAVRAS